MVDLYWLPLGAGGHSVRLNGLAYEAVAARLQRRPRRALYHSALEVRDATARYVIEMAPAWSEQGDRGVVGQGAVGNSHLGRFTLFRYEIRCWRGGHIPDVAEAVDSPQRLSDDPAVARAVLELAPSVPRPVWSTEWNSNSVIAWLIARAGIDPSVVHLPDGGRAPGWAAGLRAAG